MNDANIEGCWRDFIKTCVSVPDATLLSQFFNLFLTIEERETIASRFLIIKELLLQERTQRDIAEQFQVSIAQITRGSNALKIIDPALKVFLQHIFKDP